MSAARETVGQRVRRLRVARGLSQRDLSELGVSYAYVSRIEAGMRRPSTKALVKLARRLDTTALYLATGDGSGPCPVCGRGDVKRPRGDAP